MKLDKGLYQDSTPEEQPIGTYRWALNWVKDTQGALTTEPSVTDLNLGLSGTIVGTIPMPDKVIVFSTNAGADEIGIYSEKSDTYTPLLNDSIVASSLNGSVTNLGFSTLHQIKGIFRYNSQSEIEIVWTDGFNPPRLMYLPDVDSVVTPLDTIIKYYNNYDINKLNIFQDVTSTESSWEVIDGGALLVDSYVAFFRYVNKDGSATGCYVISNDSGSPIFISNALVGGDYYLKANADINAVTTKAIKVTFTTVDDSFESIEIGLYRSSTNECLIVGKVSIATSSYTISSIANGVTLSGGITNLLADIYKFKTVQTLTSLNQQLYLGGLTSEEVTLGQKWANAVNLSWSCKWLDFSSPAVDFKNPNTVYKTFQAGETYSFFIRGVKNNKASDWHHIPGREVKNTISLPIVNTSGNLNFSTFNHAENEKNNDLTGTDLVALVHNSVIINGESKFYQTHDALDWSTVVEDINSDINTGEFCYWENEDEVYTNYFEGDSLLIGNTVNTIVDNQSTVRHHKFPSYSTLQHMKNKYSCPEVGDLISRVDFTTTSALVDRYSPYSPTFCSVVPQLGVNVDLSGLSDIAADYDYFELGYTVRSSDDCSVIATDIALFGQYQPHFKGWYQRNGTNAQGGTGGPVSTISVEQENALLFTGGNFNNQTGAALRTWLSNGSWIKKKDGVYTEQLPGRVHFHTPDLVDQVAFDNDSLGTQVDYIENEVLISCVDLIKSEVHDTTKYKTQPRYNGVMVQDDGTGDRNSLRDFPSTVVRMNLGRHINLARDTDEARFTYQPLMNKVYLFDYTVNYIERSAGVTTITGDKSKYNIKVENTDDNNGELILARSDNWYPDAYKKQPISSKFYVAANVGTTTISGNEVRNGYIGPKGLQGGSNHLHIVLQETGVSKPTNFSSGASGTAAWASKSIIGEEVQITYDNGSDTVYTSRFMSAYGDWLPSVNSNYAGTGQFPYGDYRHNTFLTTLRKFKTNIYTSFNTKEVIKTESKIIGSGTVYYGDMFLSDVSYLVKGNPSEVGDIYNPGTADGSTVGYTYPNVNSCLYRFIAPTRKNFNYRKTGLTSLTQFNNFYPNSTFDKNLGSTGLFIAEPPADGSLKPLAMLLDTEFNLTNYLFHISSVYVKTKVFLNSFPFRILQSLVQAKESSINNWRSFPATNYYDIDKVKGYIVNLQDYDDRLLIHTNQTLLQTRGIGKLDTGDNSIVIGTGGVFEYPPQDVVFDHLGYVGTQHQHSCLLTKIGYSFIDTKRGKVFIYVKDQTPVEISAQGLFKYFRDYLHTDTVDLDEGLSQVTTAYDYKYNRLLISCKGKGDDDPFTVSFDNAWISFHSYTPDMLVNTATKLYSIFGSSMYMHNSGNTTLSLPDQDGIGSRVAEIDYTANLEIVTDQAGRSFPGNQQVLKSFQSFNWRTQVYDLSNNFKLKHNATFFKARVYNDHQLSEEIALEVTAPFTRGNVREYSGVWNFNSFRDSLDRTGFPADGIPSFISNPNKGYLLDVNNNLIDSSKFVRRFVDRYAIIRLTALGGNDQLKLIDVDSTFKKVTK